MTSSRPFTSEASAGVKCTLKLKLPPAARLRGNFPSPSTLNAPVEGANCVTWTAADPVFASETFVLAELPTLTIPNSIEDGVAIRLAAAGLFDPEPVRKTTPPQPERIAHESSGMRARRVEFEFRKEL